MILQSFDLTCFSKLKRKTITSTTLIHFRSFLFEPVDGIKETHCRYFKMLDESTAFVVLYIMYFNVDGYFPYIGISHLDVEGGTVSSFKFELLSTKTRGMYESTNEFCVIDSNLIHFSRRQRSVLIYDIDDNGEKMAMLKTTVRYPEDYRPRNCGDMRLVDNKLSYFPVSSNFVTSMQNRILIDIATGVMDKVELKSPSVGEWASLLSNVVKVIAF